MLLHLKTKYTVVNNDMKCAVRACLGNKYVSLY